MKKLREKIQKLTKKIKKCAIFVHKTHFQALRNTVVAISEVSISIKHRIKINSIKNQITSKKMGHLDKKRFSKKLLFKVKKSFFAAIKNSKNEVELLAVVWAYFKHYLQSATSSSKSSTKTCH